MATHVNFQERSHLFCKNVGVGGAVLDCLDRDVDSSENHRKIVLRDASILRVPF